MIKGRILVQATVRRVVQRHLEHSFGMSSPCGNNKAHRRGSGVNGGRTVVYTRRQNPVTRPGPLTTSHMHPNPKSPIKSDAKVLSLEGLRGYAAVAVVLSHLALEFFPAAVRGEAATSHSSWETWLYHSPFRFFYSGFFAVCIFFVMSGYVLAKKFLKTHDRSVLGEAALKRYFRLMPPVLASSMLLVISTGIYHGNGAEILGRRLLDAGAEATYRTFIFGANTYNAVIWTMQIEFLCSLLLFLFLALVGRTRYAGFALIATCATAMALSPLFGYFMALFLVGAYVDKIAAFLKPFGLSLLGMVVALYLGAYDSPSQAYQLLVASANTLQFSYGIRLNWPVFFPAIGAVLLVAAILANEALSRPLATRFSVWLGKISFSLYLTHSITLFFLTKPVFNALEPMVGYNLAAATASLIALGASLAISEPFYRLFDRPSVVLSNKVGALARRLGRKSIGWTNPV